jgi:hypothetical protein
MRCAKIRNLKKKKGAYHERPFLRFVKSLLPYFFIPYFPICTKSAGGDIGIGFKFCGSRQLSSIPICCTQDTVHRGPQNFSVEYSRWRISGVYFANGIPGYPRCCEHQCTRPSSQMYK